jgi:hypothetical protein
MCFSHLMDRRGRPWSRQDTVAGVCDTLETRLQLGSHRTIGSRVTAPQVAMVREFQKAGVGFGQHRSQLALRHEAHVRQLCRRYLASFEHTHENAGNFHQIAMHERAPDAVNFGVNFEVSPTEANFHHYGSGNVFGGGSRFAIHSMLFGNAPSASMNPTATRAQ